MAVVNTTSIASCMNSFQADCHKSTLSFPAHKFLELTQCRRSTPHKTQKISLPKRLAHHTLARHVFAGTTNCDSRNTEVQQLWRLNVNVSLFCIQLWNSQPVLMSVNGCVNQHIRKVILELCFVAHCGDCGSHKCLTIWRQQRRTMCLNFDWEHDKSTPCQSFSATPSTPAIM